MPPVMDTVLNISAHLEVMDLEEHGNMLLQVKEMMCFFLESNFTLKHIETSYIHHHTYMIIYVYIYTNVETRHLYLSTFHHLVVDWHPTCPLDHCWATHRGASWGSAGHVDETFWPNTVIQNS